MQRNSVRSLLIITIALMLVGTSMVAIHSMMAHANAGRITLNAQTVPLLRHAQFVKPMSDGEPVHLSVGLNLRSGTGIDGFLSALYDPQSPQYHHYLTPDQFTQQFAPTSDQVQEVTNYLQTQGFAVTSIASNNLLIDVVGSVQQVKQSFRTQMNTYSINNRVFHANDSPPSIPSSVGSLISSIEGLDNSVQAQPLSHRVIRQQQGAHGAKSVQAGPLGGLAPQDFLNAYDIAQLQSMGYLGNNQNIGILEFDGYVPSDINQYFQTYGITPPNITNVLTGGFIGSAGGGASEAALDIEIAGSIAPRANQIIYEGLNTVPGMNTLYNRIVTDNKVQIVSISWGLCETSMGPPEMQTLDNIFKQGAAQGISFIAASGDSGAYGCNDDNLNADFPASDPYTTGVGATHLQLSAGAYSSESVWSNPTDQHGTKGWGSGGGLSTLFKLPSWQTGPGVQNKYSNGYRQVPDITAAGDPKPGYNVYCTAIAANCPATGWITLGGTSASAPLWASGLVLVNQYLLAHNTSVIGHANPTLYRLFNSQQQFPAFHNVTVGNNLYYPATQGYSLASGIGSPDLYNIARDLAGQIAVTPPTPSPTPVVTPIVVPTTAPTTVPTVAPTTAPTTVPTVAPTTAPTTIPTVAPTTAPTTVPTVVPTTAPTTIPTVVATVAPITVPTDVPTVGPTTVPTVPTVIPTTVPTVVPTAIPTTAPTTVPTVVITPVPPPSLLQNGGFENGATPWQEQAGQGSEIIDTTNAHTGQASAYLCGYASCDDRISQVFTPPTPGTYTKITLTYWFYADTTKTTQQCQDAFTTKIETAQGGQVHTLQKSCNTDATGTWIQETYDITDFVTSYKGKSAMVMFRGTSAAGQDQTSNFYVDDVTITAS